VTPTRVTGFPYERRCPPDTASRDVSSVAVDTGCRELDAGIARELPGDDVGDDV
jgi:hypothetical protein